MASVMKLRVIKRSLNKVLKFNPENKTNLVTNTPS